MEQNYVYAVTKNGQTVAIHKEFDKASEMYKSLRYRALQQSLDKLVESFRESDVTNNLIREVVSLETNLVNPMDEESEPIFDIKSFKFGEIAE